MKGFNLRVASGQLGHHENKTRFEDPCRMACVDGCVDDGGNRNSWLIVVFCVVLL